MDTKEQNHFAHLYWFCVATFGISVACIMFLIYIPYPPDHRDMANAMIGFFSTGIVASSISFLLGGNIPIVGKKLDITPAGTTTANITAEIKSTTEEVKNKD